VNDSRQDRLPARRPLVAGNWKMNLLSGEARLVIRELLAVLSAGGPEATGGGILVCPPYTALAAVAEELSKQTGHGPQVALGAQDLHWETRGAYTGEVSGPMLAGAGCSAVIVGHSERRALFGETDEAVGRKVAAALSAGLEPVICAGETTEERQAGETEAVLVRQVTGAIARVDPGRLAAGLTFAYEPVWAIGTGAAANPGDAVRAAEIIRGCLPGAAGAVARVLYGGSVKEANVAGFMERPEIDGVLVGGASLNGRGFGLLALAGLKSAKDGR